MREGESGWFYVGDGQLRYKDGSGWTDQYKAFEGIPPTPLKVNTMSSGPTGAKVSPKGKKPRRRPILAAAVCAGLLGAGLLHPNVVHGWATWATIQAGQASALISPTTSPVPTTSKDVNTNSTAVKTAAKKAAAAKAAAARAATAMKAAAAAARADAARTAAAVNAPVRRDANGFALGGPPQAIVPANYDHPSQSDCLQFRNELRAWSNYQNEHRPAGSTNGLPASGDVQYLFVVCHLRY